MAITNPSSIFAGTSPDQKLPNVFNPLARMVLGPADDETPRPLNKAFSPKPGDAQPTSQIARTLQGSSDQDQAPVLQRVNLGQSEPLSTIVPDRPQGQIAKVLYAPPPDQQQLDTLRAKRQSLYDTDARPYGFGGAPPSPEHPGGLAPNHPGKWGHALHALSVAGQIAGDIFAPNIMAEIPGTQLNRQVQEQGYSNEINREQQSASENRERDALTAKTQADTDLLQHPRPTYQPLDTGTGVDNYDPHTGTATPMMGPNGQPVMPYTKPGPMQHVTVAGPDGKPQFANYQDGKYLDAQGKEIPNAQPYEKSTEQHVAMLGDDGKPTFGNYVNGKWTDAQGRAIQNPRPIPPPPSYGQLMLPTKTITAMVNGIPTIMQWDEKTQTYDKPAGQSSTGSYSHEEAQAGAVQRAGQELIQTLQANRNNLGTLGAWVSKYGLNTPIADPKLAGIQAQLASFAALNPAMHGARGLHAMEHFEKLIGGIQNNPDAAIAGIQAIINTAGAINPNLNQPPAASNGKVVSLKQAMGLPQFQGKSADEVRKEAESRGYKVTE